MKDKIKILFEELGSKYPEILDDEFIKKFTAVLENIVESEVTSGKEAIIEAYKKEEDEKDKKGADDKDKKDDDDEEDDEKDDEEDVKESLNRMIDILDVFCEEAADQFMAENKEIIDESIKVNVNLDVIKGIKSILEGHGIEINGEKEDELSKLKRTVESQNKTIAGLTDKLNENKVTEVKITAKSIINEATASMTEDQKERFIKLVEDYDVENIDTFKDKVTTLSEMINFKSDSKTIADDAKVTATDAGLDKMNEDLDKKEKDKKENDKDEDEDNFMSKVRKNLVKS